MRTWHHTFMLCFLVLLAPAVSSSAMAPVEAPTAEGTAQGNTATESNEPFDLAARHAEIVANYRSALPAVPSVAPGEAVDAKVRAIIARGNSAARKERLKALTELAAEAEAQDGDQLTVADHALLAEIYFELGKLDDTERHARATISIQADHAQANALLIRALAGSKQIDEAQAALAAALQSGVDPAQLSDRATRCTWRVRVRVAGRKLPNMPRSLLPHSESNSKRTFVPACSSDRSTTC